MQEKCSPEAHDCKMSSEGACPWTPPPHPPMVEHWRLPLRLCALVLPLWCLKKSHFPTNMNSPMLSKLKRLANAYIYLPTLHNICKISTSFTSAFPGYGTCLLQYQLNSLGSIQPCCHHGAGNHSITQAFSVYHIHMVDEHCTAQWFLKLYICVRGRSTQIFLKVIK